MELKPRHRRDLPIRERPSNRTSMELKHHKLHLIEMQKTPSNRTSMELKLVAEQVGPNLDSLASNRTSMELKLVGTAQVGLMWIYF